MKHRSFLLGVLVLSPEFAIAQLPANAHKTQSQVGWACDDGYVKRASKCVSLSKATNAEIRKLLILTSIAMYSGSCPCPYNVDRAGRACGRRSAYSRPGGRAPLCYDSDITDEEIHTARERARRVLGDTIPWTHGSPHYSGKSR